MPPYLLGLRLDGRRAVVVGGGRVAQRRVPALLAAGAEVVLVSPEITPALEDLADRGELTWERRPYHAGDCEGAWLVQACTDDGKVNAAVAAEAEHARVWCVRADDAQASAAWTPASGRAGETTIGVLAGGDPRRAAGVRDAALDGLRDGTLNARHSRHKPVGVALVGGGPGDPGLITVRGRRLLGQADVVITDRLAPRELLDELAGDVEIIDAAKIPYGRSITQEHINAALVEHARAGRFVVRLKGGDPFVFGRGAEEVLHCVREGIPVTVVPGITSAIAVPSAAGIPVTHRGVAQEFHVVSAHVAPGHAASTVDWEALGRSRGTLILLMAVERIGVIADTLMRYGRSPDTPVAVIQDGTLQSQRTLMASLATVADEMTASGVRPPAIIVAGEVVQVAQEIEMLRADMGAAVTPPADQGGAEHRAASLPLDEVLAELRDQIASFRFVLDAPGAVEAAITQQDLLNQLDDYVLPRVRRTDSPLLVVLSGSTGAGKSTLVNTLVGARVSATGVLRPTTSSPILVCHPDDADWWLDSRYVLPGFGRIPGPAPDAVVGDQLVIMKSEVLPRGLALLDSPDVDSVFEDHHEFAAQFLAAADIWMCVTTAARYADAQVWRLLHRARDHGATLGIVLSRVPAEGGEEVVAHFAEMLKDNGLEHAAQFTIPETKVSGGMLPKEMSDEVHSWLTGITEDEDGRAEVIRSTLGSVLDTFRTRVPELAKRVEEQVALRTMLREEVEAAYATCLAELDEATRNGSLLRGEVLARWQDFAGTGDLERALQASGSSAGHRGGKRRRAPTRVRALKVALRSGLESLVMAAAERAAEDVVTRWRSRPAGADLLEGRADALGRASAELSRRVTRAVSAWQDHIIELIRTEGVTKRSVAKFVSYDEEALSLVMMVGLFGFGTSDVNVEAGTSAVPQRLLKALFGAESLRSMSAKARADLRSRIGMLYDEEAIRFGQTLDGAGVPDETTPVQLYQATYNLEVAR